MLERTAAGIEPRSLQRALSKPARSAKRHRQLKTGFWQHGASAIDLGSAWPTTTRAPDASADTAPQPTSLAASSFFLDFLYPNAARASLRRTYPSLPRVQDGNRLPALSRRRRFASSTSPEDGEATEEATEHPASGLPSEKPQPKLSFEDRMRQSRIADSKGKGKGKKGEAGFEGALEEDLFKIEQKEKAPSIESIAREARLDASKTFPNRPRPKPSDLPNLLLRPEDERYHDIWDLYCRVGKEDQEKFRVQVVLYFSESRSVVETGRCMSLLPQVKVDQWTEEFLAAAVLTYMRSGDLPLALDQFKAGLKSKALPGGMEYLLSDAIINHKWPEVVDIWMTYYNTCLASDASTHDLRRLQQLKTLPDLGRLYVSFESWIAGTARDGQSGLVSTLASPGLGTFRRKLAEMALEQGCSPRQAELILKYFSEHQLYHDYILRMIKRWQGTLETKGSLTILPDIYNTYRQMKDFRPSVELLHGMFELYFPHAASGLEDVFSDWHRTWGDLDQRGFEKFLKFYSRVGDVKAVQTLWERYAERFPEVLHMNMAFRSTMNVYASIGDVAQAEKEMRKMTKKYGVLPDISTWNTMLKCCVRADDYDLVMRCFKQICEICTPDSFTYAHAMAMTAKVGDLDKTLELFSESQKAGVPTSSEMVLGLVMVYCKNDQLEDAESICIGLAERKITRAAAWNELLRFNGMQGHLDKCYELLQTMKSFNVEWNHDTYVALFEAMVKVDQVQDAYNLILRAHADRLFTVGPDHWAAVLAGAARTGETSLVVAIRKHMGRSRQQMNFNAYVACVEAAYKEAPRSITTRTMARDMVEPLRSVLSYRGVDDGEKKRREKQRNNTVGSVADVTRDVRHLVKETASVGRAIHILISLREFAIAEDLVEVYMNIFPDRQADDAFPQSIFNSLMQAYLADGNYKMVHQKWDQTFKKVLADYSQPQGGIYPAKQYVLARSIDVMANVFREEQDGPGLLKFVRAITDAGFKMSCANWNKVLRSLSELGQWEPAMEWCETLLMPQWRGWTAGRRRLQERRDANNTRLLWPTSATIFALQAQWLTMRSLAAWSADVSLRLGDVERRFPRLHQAFISSEQEHVTAKWVLQGKVSVQKAIDELLQPMSRPELGAIRRALQRQLQREKVHDPSRAMKNPFHRVTKEAGGKVSTAAVLPPVLKRLDAALRERLGLPADEAELVEETRALLARALP